MPDRLTGTVRALGARPEPQGSALALSAAHVELYYDYGSVGALPSGHAGARVPQPREGASRTGRLMRETSAPLVRGR